MGPVAAARPARGPRRRRPVGARVARDPRHPRAERDSERLPHGGLADGAQAPRRGRPRAGAPGGDPPRRARPGRADARTAGRGPRGNGGPRRRRVRRRRDRRRSGGPVRGRLRSVRGARDPRARGARGRRPGGVELADPELPRLPARRERVGAGRTGLPAGVGLRGQGGVHLSRHRARARRRATGRRTVEREGRDGRVGGPRHGGHLPAAGRARARGAERGGRLLRGRDLRGPDRGGGRRLRGRGCQLRRPDRAAPGAPGAQRDAGGPRPIAASEDVRLPDPGARGHAKHPRAARDLCGRAAAARGGSRSSSCTTRRGTSRRRSPRPGSSS